MSTFLGLLSSVLQMMGVIGGQERTLTQFRHILAAAGWKVVCVDYGAPFILSNQKVIAVPM
jgi:hypothetical protein